MARWPPETASLASKCGRRSVANPCVSVYARGRWGAGEGMPVTEWARRVETLSPQKRALLERALERKREEAAGLTPIPRRSSPGPAPLSFPQQRIWFLEQWEPGSFTHNGARAFRLRGPLDARALERALSTF